MRNTKRSKPHSRPKNTRIMEKPIRDLEMVFKEGHELFTKLISVIPDAVILSDLNGKVIYINDIGTKVVGYSSAEEIVGKDALLFIVPEQHERVKRGFAQRMKGKLGSEEYTVIAEDGTLIPCEFNGNILRNSDGSPFATVHVARNILERKKAEEALLKSEQKYRAILDKSPDAILIRDSNGTVIDSGDQIIRVFKERNYWPEPLRFISSGGIGCGKKGIQSVEE